jgi:hypothetical protein
MTMRIQLLNSILDSQPHALMCHNTIQRGPLQSRISITVELVHLHFKGRRLILNTFQQDSLSLNIRYWKRIQLSLSWNQRSLCSPQTIFKSTISNSTTNPMFYGVPPARVSTQLKMSPLTQKQFMTQSRQM